MLRSHFQEKSPTELFQQLVTTVQEPKEEPQAFVIRCMELRQKILFGNKEADLGVEYNPKTVQTLFLHSIETGLTSETIHTKMRPFLREGVTDEQLIQEITVAASTENERQNKLNAANRGKQAKVASIQPNETAAECKTKPQPKSALEAMQSELAAIKETVSTRPTTPLNLPKQKVVIVFSRNKQQFRGARAVKIVRVKIWVPPASIVLSVGILLTLLGVAEIGDNSVRKTGVSYF